MWINEIFVGRQTSWLYFVRNLKISFWWYRCEPRTLLTLIFPQERLTPAECLQHRAYDCPEPGCPLPSPAPSSPRWNNTRAKALECMSTSPFLWAAGIWKPGAQSRLSDPNLGVWWPWPPPHPFLLLGATSVPFPRTPKSLAILEHHLGAPFVFSGEISGGFVIKDWTWSASSSINWSGTTRSERTVNNECLMSDAEWNLGQNGHSILFPVKTSSSRQSLTEADGVSWYNNGFLNRRVGVWLHLE